MPVHLLGLFSVKGKSSRSLRFLWFLQAFLKLSHPRILVSRCFANPGCLSLLWKLDSYPVPGPLTPVPKLLSPCPLERGCPSGHGPGKAGGSFGPQEDSLTGLSACHTGSRFSCATSGLFTAAGAAALENVASVVVSVNLLTACNPSPAGKMQGTGMLDRPGGVLAFPALFLLPYWGCGGNTSWEGAFGKVVGLREPPGGWEIGKPREVSLRWTCA